MEGLLPGSNKQDVSVSLPCLFVQVLAAMGSFSSLVKLPTSNQSSPGGSTLRLATLAVD